MAGGLALAGCTPSEEPSEQPPAPGTPSPAAAEQPVSHQPSQEGQPAQEGAGAEHSSTDREFAEELLGNREQVLELADAAGRNAGANAVRTLANDLRGAAQPQADQLTGWLSSTAGQESSSDPQDQAPAGDLAGTLDDEQVQQLTALGGAQFDSGFRQAVTELADGAEQLARVQLEEGSSAEMRGLAEQVLAEHEEVLAAINGPA
nr:DUF305 domain-containing protein [Saccharopolyspora sp. HNM0983]